MTLGFGCISGLCLVEGSVALMPYWNGSNLINTIGDLL